MHSECTIVRVISVDWLHTAKLGFRNGLEASVGKSFVRHLRAVFYELATDRIDRLKLRGCVVPELFAPLLKSEYNNPAKHGHQRLRPCRCWTTTSCLGCGPLWINGLWRCSAHQSLSTTVAS
eukprot:scpid40008/ scgid27291/ 